MGAELTYKSLLKRLMILPTGVVSKNDIGASSTTSRSFSNIDREARSPANTNSRSLKKVAKLREEKEVSFLTC